LLELARMQSQALEKASAERDVLMERLAILPAEMQKLYERLGSLQAEVSRLEHENLSHRSANQQGAPSERSSWWRRLFNIE
jgi:predicted nuclease with TOPRIM domain